LAVALYVIALFGAYLIGLILPSTALAALAGAVFGFVVMTFGDFPLGAPPQMQLNPSRLVTASLIAAIAGLLALHIPGRIATSVDQGRSRLSILAGAGGIAIASALIAAPTAGAIQIDREPPVAPVCSDGPHPVCVWPEHATFLPVLEPLAERVVEVGTGIFELPEQFEQDGLSSTGGLNSFSWLARGAGTWHAAEGFANVLINQTATARNCWPTDDADWESYRQITVDLQYWLTARAFGAARPIEFHGQFDDVSAAQAALKLDEAAQRDWARDQLARQRAIPCEYESETDA
jgi:hypothetical protein